jgi:hypothetical protein
MVQGCNLVLNVKDIQKLKKAEQPVCFPKTQLTPAKPSNSTKSHFPFLRFP